MAKHYLQEITKETTIKFPINGDVKYGFIHGKLVSYRGGPKPLLILFNSSTGSRSGATRLARHLSIYGFSCFIPYYSSSTNRLDLDIVEYFNLVIDAFVHFKNVPKEVKKVLVPQKIGIIGCSSGTISGHQ